MQPFTRDGIQLEGFQRQHILGRIETVNQSVVFILICGLEF